MKTVWLPIGLGVLMIVCGIIALLNPFATTLAVEQFLAWVFLIGGVFQLIAVFSANGTALALCKRRRNDFVEGSQADL